MPKSYSQFKYEDIMTLGLELREKSFLSDFPLLSPSDFLKETLKINTKKFLSTEKAKSEFIIAPVLFEIARKNEDKISFFSGHNLDVDKDLGLKGFCDFLFARVPESPVIREPIFCLVEAKNDNLEKGIPQCIAEMYASRLFNERNKKQIDNIYGCVTTGYQWLFLKLEKQTAYQDTTIYSLNEIAAILGVLQYIVEA